MNRMGHWIFRLRLRSVIYSAIAVAVLLLLSPWILALTLVAYVVTESFPQGFNDKMPVATLHQDNAKLLAQLPPTRLATLLEIPSPRIRAVVCLSLGAPDNFPKDSDWTGVAAALAETMVESPEQKICFLAQAALNKVPLRGSQQELRELVKEVPSDHPAATTLVRFTWSRFPDLRPSLHQQILRWAESKNLAARSAALGLLSSYVPDDPHVEKLVFELMNEQARPAETRLALRFALRSRPELFRQFLGEPGGVWRVIDELVQIRFLSSEGREANPELLRLVDEVADHAAKALKSEDDIEQIRAAIRYLRRFDARRLLAAGTTVEGRVRLEILEEINRGIWIRGYPEFSDAYAALLFDDAVSEKEKAAIARVFEQRVFDLTLPEYRSQFRELLYVQTAELRNLATQYFLEANDWQPADIDAIIQAIAQQADPQEQLFTQLLSQHANRPAVQKFAAEIVQDEMRDERQRIQAFVTLYSQQADQLKQTPIQFYRSCTPSGRIEFIHQVLRSPENAEVLTEDEFPELIQRDLSASEEFNVLHFGTAELVNLEQQFGSVWLQRLAVEAMQEMLERQAESELHPRGFPIGKPDGTPINLALRQVISDSFQQPKVRQARLAAKLLCQICQPQTGMDSVVLDGLMFPDDRVILDVLEAASRFHTRDERVLERVRLLGTVAENSSLLIAAWNTWADLDLDDPKLLKVVRSFSDNSNPSIRQAASFLMRKVQSRPTDHAQAAK